MHCPALVNQSRAGQGTLVLISKNIIHGTKSAAPVTKTYSNQDRETISLLSTVGQISCNVQSLLFTTLVTIDCTLTKSLWSVLHYEAGDHNVITGSCPGIRQRNSAAWGLDRIHSEAWIEGH